MPTVEVEWLRQLSLSMRTHLNVIFGMNQLLTSTNLNTEQALYNSMIRSGADFLMQAVTDVVDSWEISSLYLSKDSLGFSIQACAEEAIDSTVRSPSNSYTAPSGSILSSVG